MGQDLGGAVALAAVARDRNNADGLSCESLFRTLPELLRASGLSQVPAAVERHRFLVETSDEPLTAVSGLHVPMHLTLGKKDDVWPNAWAQDVARQSLSRVDRWIVPEGGHRGSRTHARLPRPSGGVVPAHGRDGAGRTRGRSTDEGCGAGGSRR